MDVDGDIPAVAVSKNVLLISEMLSASLIIIFCQLSKMAVESLLEKQAEAKQGFLALSCLLLFCYNASLGLNSSFPMSTFIKPFFLSNVIDACCVQHKSE